MKKVDIIILAGQSNAVGVGHVQYLPKHFSGEKVAEFMRGYEKVKINYFSHDKKSNGFVNTTVGCTEKTKDTVGPEIGIAERITELYPDRAFFIVKCAFGGVSLYKDWCSPSKKELYNQDAYFDVEVHKGFPTQSSWCYNEMVKILKESIVWLENAGFEPRIKGWCWMQGEHDASSKETVLEYERNYHYLLTDLQREFSQYMAECAYVDAGISSQWPFYKELNEIKKLYAQTHDNCFYVDTIKAGLSTMHEPEDNPDVAHYDCGSIIELGRLFADNILISIDVV